MKILDRYIIKQFTQTIFFGIFVFLTIFIVIDLMENLDNFIDHGVPTDVILSYYVVFLPEIVKLMLPVAVLLACLFTVGKMSTQNELAAIKSSGVSLYRFMIPFIIVAFLVSVMAIYFGGYIVPMANKEKVHIERTYIKKDPFSSDNNIYFQDSQTRIVTISYFNIKTNRATRVSIQDFDGNNINHMTHRIDANKMIYDSTNSAWQLINGIERNFNDKKNSFYKFDTLRVTDLSFSPEDVIKKQRQPTELSLPELQEYAEDLVNSGNDPSMIQIEYHSRYAFAFASFVVVLFGLPLSANKRRGGLAIQFGINIAVTFIYLVFMKVSQAMGQNGSLDPMFTAWLANFIFLGGAIINILRVRK